MVEKKINFSLIILIVLLNLFWLPADLPWDLYPNSKTLSQKIIGSSLYRYLHPQTPVIKSTVNPPLQAISYLLIDSDTNTILTSKNSNLRIYPASTTKLATALTALNVYPLEEVVSVESAYGEGKVMGLVSDEKITVRSLVEALLVYSANDAAFALASHHQQGTNGFIKEMNQLLSKYNLKDSHFVNYDGIHHSNHYSTAYDLSQLARLSIKNPTVREVVKVTNITVSDVGNQIHHQLQTTNELLGIVPEIEGLKTGWTPESDGSFIGLINLNGHKLISVVTQSPDRFADTRLLVDWSRQNLSWQSYQ